MIILWASCPTLLPTAPDFKLKFLINPYEILFVLPCLSITVKCVKLYFFINLDQLLNFCLISDDSEIQLFWEHENPLIESDEISIYQLYKGNPMLP